MRLKKAGARWRKSWFLKRSKPELSADSDEESLKSFKQGNGVCLADALEASTNKGKESNFRTQLF